MIRLTPKELHPLVFDAMERYRKSFMYAYGQAGTAEKMETYQKHQSAWWKAYGKQVLLGTLGSLTLIILSIAWFKNSQSPLALLSMLVSLFGSITFAVVAHQRNKFIATVEELEALMPSLEMDEVGKTYCETLFSVLKTKAITDEDRTALVRDLWQLMEEHQRLVARQSELGGIRTLGEQGEIAAEVKELEHKLEQSTDEEARQTYSQALESAKRQHKRLNAIKPLLERFDAQSALVLNTLRETREAYANSDSLRDRLSDRQTISTSISMIYAQTEALDKAFAELDVTQ